MLRYDGGFPDAVMSFEFVFGLTVGALTVGCVLNWFKVWRHDPQGRIFFTLLTIVSLLVTLGIVADWTRRALGY